MNIEKIFHMLSDMEKLTPGRDKLSELIEDTLAPAADELTEDELDFLAAAGPAADLRKNPREGK